MYAIDLIRKIEHLSPRSQREVNDFIDFLAAREQDITEEPKGVPGKNLLKFAGTISKEDVRTMTEAIEEGCEQIDYESWK